MKSKGFLLMKIQLLGQFKGREKSRGNLMMLAAWLFVGVVAAAYSFLLAFGLGAMGLSDMIPGYALMITSLITLFFTILKTNGVLFAYKDYDLVMALPVKTETVIASRFMTMYVINLLFMLAVMIPMGAGYVIWERPGISFYPIWILGMAAAPLIPTTIATVIGALIILISSRFRHANLLTTLLTIGFTCGIVALSMGAGGVDEEALVIEDISRLGSVMLAAIHKIYPPTVLFERAVISCDLASLLLFAGISIVWYLIFLKAVSLKYKSMNTGLMTWHTRGGYKIGTLKSSGPVAAICKKEAKRFFGCPVYATNMGIGIVLMLIFGVMFVVMGPEKVAEWMKIPGMEKIVIRLLPYIIAMLQCMSCTTSVSLSLEGKNLWILKSLPLEKKTVYQGKILFNLLLTVPAGLLMSLLIAFRFPMDLGMRLLLFLIPAVYAVFTSVLGMYFNIKMPKYDWNSETSVVKQSASSMAGIFAGLLNALIPLVIVLMLSGVFAEIFAFALVFLEGILAYFLFRHVCTLEF
jgi:ABC-2 type transport system permease protein